MKYLDAKWYFIICAVIFVIAILRSLKMQRMYNRAVAAEHRRTVFWVASGGLLIAFLIINRGVLGNMDEYGRFSDGTTLIYGQTTADRIKAAKNMTDYAGDLSGDVAQDQSDQPSTATPVVERGSMSDDEDTTPSFTLTPLAELPDGCTLIKPQGVKASNSLTKYPPQMVTDGDTATSWQATVDDPEKYNGDEDLSEWLYFGFGAEKEIAYIVIHNGTPDSEERYKNNGRAHEVRFSDLSRDPDIAGQYLWSDFIELRDEPACQIIECGNLTASELYLNIDTMYKGKKYNELCISDVEFYAK